MVLRERGATGHHLTPHFNQPNTPATSRFTFIWRTPGIQQDNQKNAPLLLLERDDPRRKGIHQWMFSMLSTTQPVWEGTADPNTTTLNRMDQTAL